MPSPVQTKYKVACVQAAPEFLDIDKGVAKAVRLIEEAAAQKASLIAFPEVWLPGYPWWIWLDSPAWGMQFVQRYFENALVIGSPQWERLCKAAADNNIHVHAHALAPRPLLRQPRRRALLVCRPVHGTGRSAVARVTGANNRREYTPIKARPDQQALLS